MLSISYLIGTKNEGVVYLTPLLERLIKYKQREDEIVIVDDYSDDPSTLQTLEKYKDHITVYKRKLEDSFADHKNYMSSLAKGDFIFNIDADELPNETLLQTIKEIIINNPNVDLYHVPRINIVHGITPEYIAQMGWKQNDKGWINYYDPQGRVYRNTPNIKWVNKIHEKISGHKEETYLPAFDSEGNIVTDYCLLHVKQFQRQLDQNLKYEKMM